MRRQLEGRDGRLAAAAEEQHAGALVPERRQSARAGLEHGEAQRLREVARVPHLELALAAPVPARRGDDVHARRVAGAPGHAAALGALVRLHLGRLGHAAQVEGAEEAVAAERRRHVAGVVERQVEAPRAGGSVRRHGGGARLRHVVHVPHRQRVVRRGGHQEVLGERVEVEGAHAVGVAAQRQQRVRAVPALREAVVGDLPQSDVAVVAARREEVVVEGAERQAHHRGAVPGEERRGLEDLARDGQRPHHDRTAGALVRRREELVAHGEEVAVRGRGVGAHVEPGAVQVRLGATQVLELVREGARPALVRRRLPLGGALLLDLGGVDGGLEVLLINARVPRQAHAGVADGHEVRRLVLPAEPVLRREHRGAGEGRREEVLLELARVPPRHRHAQGFHGVGRELEDAQHLVAEDVVGDLREQRHAVHLGADAAGRELVQVAAAELEGLKRRIAAAGHREDARVGVVDGEERPGVGVEALALHGLPEAAAVPKGELAVA
mmetsp:Transcript_17781/g.54376  ORF Transcript_17781/g.54376 Transcript_17781/m.54376 type:complete len:498 (+) Transcript_17781:1040-2533(+)